MEICGIIEKGKRHGTTLGYPTANIQLTQQVEGGIYAAKAHVDGQAHIAAVFVDPTRHLLEAHLLDFSGDIYEKELRVELLKKIRDSRKFEDEESLKIAIETDMTEIRAYFDDI